MKEEESPIAETDIDKVSIPNDNANNNLLLWLKQKVFSGLEYTEVILR